MGKKKQKQKMIEWITFDDDDTLYIAIRKDEWENLQYDIGRLHGYLNSMAEYSLTFIHPRIVLEQGVKSDIMKTLFHKWADADEKIENGR